MVIAGNIFKAVGSTEVLKFKFATSAKTLILAAIKKSKK